jgi:chromate transporter
MSETSTDFVESRRNIFNVFLTFLRLGLTSFGGPIAHIGYFRKELVERQHWVSEVQFSQLIAISQFLPGPASSQLGFALGLLRAGWFGAFAAFLAFTLPSALLLIGFASLLPLLSGPVGGAVIHGLKLVACAVVADAVLGMARKLCPDVPRQGIALIAASILLLAGTAWFQVFVIIGGAVAGIMLCHTTIENHEVNLHPGFGKRSGIILFVIFIALLLGLPVLASQGGLFALAETFYRSGALVFGGGHVVLPLLEESLVQTGWVSREDFLAGYGASQAIPGPMFAFSAFLGSIMPAGHGSWAGASVALIFIFLPGFLLIAAALPMWSMLSQNQKAANAIAGINAAVVGLLAAALYDPILTSGITSGPDLAIALIGFGLLTIWRLSPLLVVVWCVATSISMHYIMS